MDFFWILLLFLAFRLFDLTIIYLSAKFIPYLGFFPFKEVLIYFQLPHFISALANFDGLHYLLIAKNGYFTYQQAFFPLYLLLIHFLTPLFLNNYLITGLFISNVSFLIGLYVFYKYLKLLNYESRLIKWIFIFLLFFPTSFFFMAVYTEGLFFFLFVSSLYFLKRENYLTATLFGILCSLTRLVGVILIIPFVFQLIKNYKSKIKNSSLSPKIPYSYILVALSPILGLIIYASYLWFTTRDPLFFFHSQWAFGANRRTNIILLPQVYYRYFKLFFTARLNFQYFIAVFEFVTFNLVFIVLILDLIKNLNLKIKNFLLLGLNLFSFSNLLLPTLTGTLSSIPRYTLFSLSFFIYLAQIKNMPLKIVITLIFLIFHIIMLGFFSQGYFVS